MTFHIQTSVALVSNERAQEERAMLGRALWGYMDKDGYAVDPPLLMRMAN
jgi:hypothetical protein